MSDNLILIGGGIALLYYLSLQNTTTSDSTEGTCPEGSLMIFDSNGQASCCP